MNSGGGADAPSSGMSAASAWLPSSDEEGLGVVGVGPPPSSGSSRRFLIPASLDSRSVALPIFLLRSCVSSSSRIFRSIAIRSLVGAPAEGHGRGDLPDAHKDGRIRSTLLALGYDEAISLTFISKDDARRFSKVAELDLANPLSDEASVMRTSLVPSMLNLLAYNLNRGSENVRLFEAGKAFEAAGEKAVERKQIVFGATGIVDSGVVRGLSAIRELNRRHIFAPRKPQNPKTPNRIYI